MLTLAQAEQFVQKVCMDHRIPAPRITRHAPSALRRGAKSLHLGRGITREALRDQLAFYLYCRMNCRVGTADPRKRISLSNPAFALWCRWVENQIEKEFPLRAGRPPAVAGTERQNNV